MIKKLVVYSILLSMLVHCLCRLGFIDHLYEKRNKIAHYFGLIREVPMSICGSKYQHAKTFTIETKTSSESIPLNTKTHEINLFFVPKFSQTECVRVLLPKSFAIAYTDNYHFCFVFAFFHPPSTIA
jgi:hypothetical protein